MKRTSRFLFSLTLTALASLLSSNANAAETVFHVAPHGSAQGDGSNSEPFGSLVQARDAIRTSKSNGETGPFTVIIAGGDYSIEESVIFEAQDSGTLEAPIVFRAAQGERPRFFGGKLLDPSWFSPVDEQNFLDQLVDQSVKDKILVIDLSNRGITEYGAISRHGWAMEPPGRIPPVSLGIGGERMTLARWPNPDEESPYLLYEHYNPSGEPLKGYALVVQAIIEKIRLPGEVGLVRVTDHGEAFSQTQDFNSEGGSFEVAFDRMKHWNNPSQIFLDGVLSSTWEWTYNQIESVDIENRIITLAGPEKSGLGQGESVRLPHFHFDNIPEEIDEPSEYYIDRERGLLYLYPPDNFTQETIVLSTLSTPMIAANGADHIVFEGLTFDTGRGLGLELHNCENIEVRRCRIANFTKGGIEVNGKETLIRDSEIVGSGGFGINLLGGNKNTLTPANNEVVNCHIHDFGWDQKSQLPGVMIDGVGHRVSNCEIHNGPHFAIRIKAANDIIIENNEIYDLPKYHKFDGGSLYVYSGPRAESRGIEIRTNYFHDIPTIGVYPDNFSWGVHTYKNVFRNVGVLTNRAAVYVNGGGECRTYNNLMIDCVQSYHQGNRPKDAHWMDKWNTTLATFGDGQVEQTPYDKYPDFKLWLQKTEPDEFYRPTSHAYRNVLYTGTAELAPGAGPNGVIDRSGNMDLYDNWATDQNPGIADLASDDLSLLESSIVYSQVPGFEPIPFDQIGRKSLGFENASVHFGSQQDNLTISWENLQDSAYEILSSDNLVQWSKYQGEVDHEDGWIHIQVDQESVEQNSRFYRIQ